MELKVNKIYEHHSGDLYKISVIAFHYKTAEKYIIYHRCNMYGIFISIREVIDDQEIITQQPFIRTEESFVQNFKEYDSVQSTQ